MEKVLSIRSHEAITLLFEEIHNSEGTNQATDKSSVFNRALEAASGKEIEWSSISKSFKAGNRIDSSYLKIRIEPKNYGIYESIIIDIKTAFSLDRLKSPFFIKLLLGFYLKTLKEEHSNDILSTANRLVDFGIDGLVFKANFDSAEFSETEKKRLLSLSRVYLETCNPKLEVSIRTQMNDKIKAYSDYFNRNRYLPIRRSTLGTSNIVFTSKTLAGLLIFLSESGVCTLEEILDALECEINEQH